VLAEYGIEADAITPLGSGLINLTLRIVQGGADRYVLQRLHLVFSPEVNDAIDAVTRHLAAKGVPTPRLVPTPDGRLFVRANGSIWRLLTFVHGRTFDSVPDPAVARSAGRFLGRFHCALADLEYEFSDRHRGVHDLARHLDTLQLALRTHGTHPLADDVKRITRDVFALAAEIPEVLTISDRIVHGDPKISNLLFTGDPVESCCLLDLDTLGRMPSAYELGDAFRSWCNPGGEDTVETSFSMSLFAAAVGGYAELARDFIHVNEWQSIVPATLRIGVELAARFSADALREEYFGWDVERFGSRGEHNLVRATGQLGAVRSLMAQADDAGELVERAFRRDHSSG
jgi:Ser/Thr protein kinase RdoA (MazF antagonist)